MTPTLTYEYNELSIYFDTILHIKIKLDEFVGIQSWRSGGVFFIEYILKTNRIKSEYDTKEKWLAVLKLLDEFEFS